MTGGGWGDVGGTCGTRRGRATPLFPPFVAPPSTSDVNLSTSLFMENKGGKGRSSWRTSVDEAEDFI